MLTETRAQLRTVQENMASGAFRDEPSFRSPVARKQGSLLGELESEIREMLKKEVPTPQAVAMHSSNPSLSAPSPLRRSFVTPTRSSLALHGSSRLMDAAAASRSPTVSARQAIVSNSQRKSTVPLRIILTEEGEQDDTRVLATGNAHREAMEREEKVLEEEERGAKKEEEKLAAESPKVIHEDESERSGATEAPETSEAESRTEKRARRRRLLPEPSLKIEKEMKGSMVSLVRIESRHVSHAPCGP